MKKILAVISALLIVFGTIPLAFAAKGENNGKVPDKAQLEAGQAGNSQSVQKDAEAGGIANGTVNTESKDQTVSETGNISSSSSESKNNGWKGSDQIESLRQELDELGKVKDHAQKAELQEKKKELIREIVELKRQESGNDSIEIFVNGKDVNCEVPPVIKEGRTLIPVRAVTNALGANVDWNGDTRTVTVTKAVYGTGDVAQTIKIEFNLDSDIVKVNDEIVKIDVPAQLISNSTFVPIRFIAETFKLAVDWDSDSQTVIVEPDNATGTNTVSGDAAATTTAGTAASANTASPSGTTSTTTSTNTSASNGTATTDTSSTANNTVSVTPAGSSN